VWHKLSVPVRGSAAGAAGATPRRVDILRYFAPLGDGRALRVRVVSRPETFAEVARTIRRSLDTIELLTPGASTTRRAEAGE